MRAEHEPAWLLHHRPFQDASRILEVLTREHGRLSLVARGSRSARSRLKGVLRPFLPLRLSWVARSELGTLTGAEVRGAPIALTGDALLCGWYVNELVMHLVHRHDPQPEVFALYSATIERLRGGGAAPALREFELELLGLLGFGIDLERDTATGKPLEPGQAYEYRVEHGPVALAERQGRLVFPGAELIGVRERRFDDPAVLRAAGRLLREVIAFHLGGKELRSRKVLMDMRGPQGP
ncbi:MAG TPA: DNA repair protein RecO [Woeseiaceae bacterium]